MEKKKKRKIKKGILIFSLCFLLFWIGLGLYFFQHKSIDTKLKEIGYSKEEIKELKKSLEKKNLETVFDYQSNLLHILEEKDFQENLFAYYLQFLKRYPNATSYDIVFFVNHGLEDITYNPDIHDLIHHEKFRESYLDDYLKYYQEHQELSIDQVVIDINTSKEEEDPNTNLKPVIEEKPVEEKNSNTNSNTSSNTNSNNKSSNNNQKEPSEEDIPLEEITALFLGKQYMVSRNMERYRKYYLTHRNLSADEIITRVNSNIDLTAYKDITPTDLSKEDLLIVNKYYYLDKNYVPSNLVAVDSKYGRGSIKKEAYDAFIEMYNDASKLGLYPYIQSPYRSYSYQTTLYNNYVKRDGVKEADTYSARPGYSEHQTGLAMDLGTSKNHSIGDFEKSKEFDWVSKNAYKYGFILRYPKNKQYLTGYMYEPWHYRYVGKDIAKYIYENNITYEEYFEYFLK